MGWGVFRRKEEVLLWGDALFDPKSIDELGFFLSEVIRCENKVGGKTVMGAGMGSGLADPSDGKAADRIEAWFSPNPVWWTEALRRIGFSVEPEPHHLFPCARRFSEEFDMRTLDKHWYYTWGDSDLF